MVTSYVILVADRHLDLENLVDGYLNKGWKPVGSHQVNEVFKENRYSGDRIIGTTIDLQYSQTMIKED